MFQAIESLFNIVASHSCTFNSPFSYHSKSETTLFLKSLRCLLRRHDRSLRNLFYLYSLSFPTLRSLVRNPGLLALDYSPVITYYLILSLKPHLFLATPFTFICATNVSPLCGYFFKSFFESLSLAVVIIS